ncbi:MAG: hypothetical protein L0220_17300 [Acidobacteria bacterium]|nr:hypothetical protein [Acidobacteriota bacterium]
MVQGTEKQTLLILLSLVLIVVVGVEQNLLAQRPYRASDQQIHTLLTRIESRTNTFRSGLNDELNLRSMSDSALGHEINDAVRGFEEATNILRERFRDQRSISADTGNVLGRANRIDSLLKGIKLTARVNANWREIRADLNQLARSYNINWRWFDQGYNPARDSGSLTGTWRLDISRSDNIEQVITLAVRSLPPDQQRRARFQLMRRMESPETVGIEQRGRNLTLASTRSRQISFVADGRKRTENPAHSRSIQVNAYLNGDQLIVTTMGDRGSDYQVTFDPVDAGQRMRLTRRIYSERLSQPVSITGVYDKISDIAQLNLFSGKLENVVYHRPTTATSIVPSNTQLFAILDNELNTKELRPGDPFRLIVRSPAQYENAVIEGVVTAVERSANLSGRAALALDFERISLGEGVASIFDGYIESIRTLQGENVLVNYEGSRTENSSQNERSLKRTSIAERVGEVIGAIPKAAAIGAGSLFTQGRNDLFVRKGSEVIIRAGSPVLRSR